MLKEIRITVLAAIVLLIVGVGVAGATDYAGSKGDYGTKGKGKESKRQKALKKLDSSRLTQVAYMTGLDVVNSIGEDDIGDPDAKGSANFLQVEERTVCYGFALRGAGTPTAAAIYKGGTTAVGPPVVQFTNVPKNAVGQPFGNPGASSGCKVTEGAEQAALVRIRKNPKNYYVMFKTDGFPEGAARGQLGSVWYDNDGR